MSSVSTLARPLFFAAWVCPTIALLLGDLPRERMGAALLSAVSSGALLAALPPRGFRTARSITLTLLPLSWLWVAYVTLNGSGPTAVDALTTLVNTNTAEASGALRLMVNPASIFIGLLQAILLIASYFGGAIRFGAASRAVLAATLAWIMIGAWAQVLLSGPIRVLPTSNDWQNFPYGSLAELIGAGFSHPELLRRHAQVDRRVPVEARVTQSIDSIFVVGETFRFDRDLSAVRKSSAWSAIQMRLDEGLGALLPKVCASADATAISVPMLLTGVSPQNADQAAGTPSGLARLDAAGYATAWISNQDDNWLADEHRNLVWLSKGFNGVYDDVVLPVMSAFLHRKDPRNKGLVVHLIDSHAPYLDRYPPTPEPGGLDAEQIEVLRYLRANEHTLRILAQIGSMLDESEKPAFAVYVSDHGENLLADHNGLHFHIGARTTAEAAYVPSFVFWNAAFRRDFDPKARLQRDLAAASLAHADIYNIWMNFSGLEADLVPTANPQILGKIRVTDSKSAVPCVHLER